MAHYPANLKNNLEAMGSIETHCFIFYMFDITLSNYVIRLLCGTIGCAMLLPLHCPRNDHDGVSNHRRLNYLHCPLWGESTADRWFLLAKGQKTRYCFHLMTSSWRWRHAIAQTATWPLSHGSFWLISNYTSKPNIIWLLVRDGFPSLREKVFPCQGVI